MQSGCEVLWSPISEDNFLVWSTNLQLYQVQELISDEYESTLSPRIRLSKKTVADLIATNSSYQYLKCVSWSQTPKDDPLQQVVAVGQADGKIALTNFACSTNIHGPIGREFVPKFSRPVNALAWNSKFHQFLAAGFDKAGKDHCIYVIDVNKGLHTSNLGNENRNSTNRDHLQIAFECSIGESVHSVVFSKEDPQILYAGLNKQIKLYDFREGKSASAVSTKAVFGICTDPFNNHRFASYIDNIVHIWDTRNFERPVLTLTDNSNKSIFKLSWCPTRNGFLSTLSRESSLIRLYDILQFSAEEDQEPAVITRSISAKPNDSISSFSWHPCHENRILNTYYSGIMVDYVIGERVTMNWSISNTLVWSCGKKSLKFLDERCSLFKELEDLSTVIKERAKNRYGLEKNDLSLNGEITGDPTLKRLWTWLEEARKLALDQSIKIPGMGSYNYQGISSLLTLGTLKSDILNKQWIGIEGSKTVHAKLFVSEERNLSLSLCSWGFEKEGSLHQYISYLDSIGHYSRAAAVAVFNLHIPLAIVVLQKGAKVLDNPSYNTTAMALAGFTSERKALWRETCSTLLKHISDPYLRTTFAFLTGDSETYDSILTEKKIAVHDRVAFACKYLSDVRLLEYIHTLNGDLIERGDLDGILLTGLNSEGQDLLQMYIDLTGDIQTPALLVVHMQPFIATDTRLQIWVDSYRNMLDSLQLWKERVQIDVLRHQGKDASKLPQQIYISCNFCLKSISSYIQAPGRMRNHYDQSGTRATNKFKMTACPNPNCRKPLPRCSLCLQRMGTPSKRENAQGRKHPTDDSIIPTAEANTLANFNRAAVLKQFDNWFTWCDTCRHGGHAQHMIQWFKEHMECPVASCACRCMIIDAENKLQSATLCD